MINFGGDNLKMESGYSIKLARPEHLDDLPVIEREAALLFRDWNVPEIVIEAATPIEEFQAAQEAGHLWVALSPQDRPVGFAIVAPEGNRLHLEEMDVHPLHGRRGVGSALVTAVCDWARECGYVEITLTTYRDIPWNAPFYAKLGFEALNTAEMAPELRERVEAEAARGLDPARRIVMRKLLQTAAS